MSGKNDGWWDSFNGTIDVNRASYDADYKAGLNSSYGSWANTISSSSSSSPDFTTSSTPDYSSSVGSSSSGSSIFELAVLAILLILGINYFSSSKGSSASPNNTSNRNNGSVSSSIHVFSGAGLNIRSEPGVINKNNIIGTLNQGDKVNILGETRNINGNQWLYIETVTYQGWVKGDLLDGSEQDVIRSASGAGLNVRSEPGIIDKNNVVGTLAPKTKVKVLGEVKNVNGSQWLHIETIAYQGWVNGDILKP